MKHPLHQFKHCPKCGSSTFHEHNFKAYKCNDCGFIYYFNPSSATVAFILNEKGELLVCRRAHDPAKGTLDLPGGFVDMDETGEEAIMREVEEETGLKTKELQYQFSLPNRYVYSDFEVHTLDMFFTIQVEDASELQANDDVEESFFAPLDKINPAEFGLLSVRKGLERFLSERLK
jgi:ADP-ribose pyrophosphatase